jgi:putative inorganic carbon (HCO3(-)) transporter
MLFALLIGYIALFYIHPAEIFPALAPYPITYYAGMGAVALSVLWLAFRGRTPLASWQLWFLAAFTAVMTLSRILNERYLGAVVPTFNHFGPSIAMFVVTLCAVNSLKKLKIAAMCLIALSLVLVAQGAAAYHLGFRSDWFLLDPMHLYSGETGAPVLIADRPDLNLANPDENSDQADEEELGSTVRIRGSGMLHDPNDLAQALVLALPLLGVFWKRGAVGRNLLLVLLPATVLVYGVFLTHSRGGTIALILTLGLAMSRRFGKGAAIVVLLVLATGALATNFAGGRHLLGGDESAVGRVDAWSEGLQMLKEKPFLGVGYGQFIDYNNLTAHNAFVLCFAETGLIGYFFWLALQAFTFLQLGSLRRLPVRDTDDEQLRRWAGVLQLSMMAFLVAAVFLSRTFTPLLYLVLGLATALLLIAIEANKPIWRPSLLQFSGVVPLEFATISVIYVIARFRIA